MYAHIDRQLEKIMPPVAHGISARCIKTQLKSKKSYKFMPEPWHSNTRNTIQ